jgi:hypothetical protein
MTLMFERTYLRYSITSSPPHLNQLERGESSLSRQVIGENAINSPDNLLVESPHLEEIGAILTRHAVSKVPPEARVSRYHKLIGLRRQLFALQRVHDMGIVKAEHDGIVNL